MVIVVDWMLLAAALAGPAESGVVPTSPTSPPATMFCANESVAE